MEHSFIIKDLLGTLGRTLQAKEGTLRHDVAKWASKSRGAKDFV